MNKIIDRIYFDFDSTLIKAESLDLLGVRRGVGKEVAEMTARSMNGEISFADIFVEKMKLISPLASDVDAVARDCENLIVGGAKETVELLHALNKKVYVLSANFYPIILPTAKYLGLQKENIVANEIYFDASGNYLGFNTESFLSQNQGKAKFLKQEKLKGGSVALVGDGASDLEVSEEVDTFVGFGGVVRRPKVEKEAKYFVFAPSLLAVLNFLLTLEEMEELKNMGFGKLINKVQKLTTTTTTGPGLVSW